MGFRSDTKATRNSDLYRSSPTHSWIRAHREGETPPETDAFRQLSQENDICICYTISVLKLMVRVRER